MSESSSRTTKKKTTEIRSARRGIMLHKTVLALPCDLVVAFRVQCLREGTSMSCKFESWVAEYLESVQAAPK